jgi:ribonuclease-3
MNSLVLLSKHVEENCDGRDNIHILEDIFEAFIGALYLDTNDFLIVKRFIINLIEKYVDFPDLIMNDKNYKEQIMKYLQHNYNSNPTYEHIECSEDLFKCKIIHNSKTLAVGEGKTKKKAEQNAAYRALIIENVVSE